MDAEVEAILADLRRGTGGRGAAPARHEDEATLAKARELASKRVQNTLLLETVAKQEGLEVSEDELQKEVESAAATLNRKPEALRDMLEREGRIEAFRMRLLEGKALDLLYKQANIVEGQNLVALA